MLIQAVIKKELSALLDKAESERDMEQRKLLFTAINALEWVIDPEHHVRPSLFTFQSEQPA
jgi:hypothetical protein